ncbi:MAG: exodeoxyribonuclease VII large subunit, partial [Planctomycetes bacterium]|nr:exodeoxyribonuclease VII large subunit [Planctomycetota bacterium]
MDEARVYSVSDLQREVRGFLERRWGSVTVEGEISGHRLYPSGHHYFTLKDEGAQLSAVLWRSAARRLRFDPEDGMLVRVRGALTLYEVRGQYQIVAETIEPVGAGPLQIRFEQMRRRLEEEGLFAAERKVPCPLPLRIASSPARRAVVRDLIQVARRRWPILASSSLP